MTFQLKVRLRNNSEPETSKPWLLLHALYKVTEEDFEGTSSPYDQMGPKLKEVMEEVRKALIERGHISK
jgi:hypothetical protein